MAVAVPPEASGPFAAQRRATLPGVRREGAERVGALKGPVGKLQQVSQGKAWRQIGETARRSPLVCHTETVFHQFACGPRDAVRLVMWICHSR